MPWIAPAALVDQVHYRCCRRETLVRRITSAERGFVQDVPIRIRRHEIARALTVRSLQTEDKPVFVVKSLLFRRMQAVRRYSKAQPPYSIFRHHSFR
jgi:hypothetical protein